MAALKAPFPAFGGKSRVADLVWSRFGEVRNYVEPFCFSAAMLLLRHDEPLDAPVPDEFEPFPYYFEQIEATKQQLAYIEQATDEECEVAANNSYQDSIAGNENYEANRDAENDRYEAMRLLVDQWEPPSDEHRGLKKFMLEQLATSRNPVFVAKPAAKVSGQEYRRNKIEKLKERLATYEKEWADEVERTRGRNEWLRQLRESLN